MTKCGLTSDTAEEHTKSHTNIATISQNLDTLSNLNLIYSKTQVSSLFNSILAHDLSYKPQIFGNG